VRVDDQRFETRTPSHEIMAGIADDETQVALARKVNAGFDMLLGGSLDDIQPVKTPRACAVRIVGRQTCVVCVERPEVS